MRYRAGSDQNVVGAEVGMEVAAEGVGVLGAKVGLDAAPGAAATHPTRPNHPSCRLLSPSKPALQSRT